MLARITLSHTRPEMQYFYLSNNKFYILKNTVHCNYHIQQIDVGVMMPNLWLGGKGSTKLLVYGFMNLN